MATFAPTLSADVFKQARDAQPWAVNPVYNGQMFQFDPDGGKEVLVYSNDNPGDGTMMARYVPQQDGSYKLDGSPFAWKEDGWGDFLKGALMVAGSAVGMPALFGAMQGGAGAAAAGSLAGDAMMPGALGANGANMGALSGLEGYASTAPIYGGSAAGQALPALQGADLATLSDFALRGGIEAGGAAVPGTFNAAMDSQLANQALGLTAADTAGYAGGVNLGSLGGTGVTNALSKLVATGDGFDWTKLIGPAASLAGGAMSAGAAKDAASMQAQAQREAMAQMKPWMDTGSAALNRLRDLYGIGGNTGAQGYGSFDRNFGMADFQADPGYQFRMDEGQKALERSAAARGGLLSGKAAKDTLRFAQGLGAQEYGNAYNRFQTDRTNRTNPLLSMAGLGQSAANTVNSNITNAGDAAAAGRVGSANAWNQALGQGWSMYQNQQNTDRQNALLETLLRRG